MERDLDHLTGSGGPALPQRGHDAEREMDPRGVVGDREPLNDGRPARYSGGRHGAAGRLRDEIETLVGRIRAPGAESLGTREDEPRVLRRQHVVADTERFEFPGGQVLNHDIRIPDQFEEQRSAPVRFQVQRDAAFGRIEGGKEARHLPPELTDAGHLHFDDVGAEPGELLTAHRAHFELGDLDHPDAVQGRQRPRRIARGEAPCHLSCSGGHRCRGARGRRCTDRRSAPLRSDSVPQSAPSGLGCPPGRTGRDGSASPRWRA